MGSIPPRSRFSLTRPAGWPLPGSERPHEWEATRERQFLRLRAVLKKSGVSKATLYRWIQSGAFPPPCPLNDAGNAVGWLEDEVEEWIDRRIAARNHPSQAGNEQQRRDRKTPKDGNPVVEVRSRKR